MTKQNVKTSLKDNKLLLILIPVFLLVLMLVVFFKTNNNDSETMKVDEPKNTILEPMSEEEKKLADKLEAYKKDREAEKREKQILEDSKVKGSDFYFDMQETDSKYKENLKKKIQRMQSDPYQLAMSEYRGGKSGFEDRMRDNLSRIEDSQEAENLAREGHAYAESRKELEKRMHVYDDILGKYLDKKKDSMAVSPEVKAPDDTEEVKTAPRFIVNENGKRQRKPQYVLPGKKNLIKAAIYGDQTIVSGTPVKMRLLEPLLILGVEIPANTIFSGTASIGASRMKITVENFRYGTFMSPVSFIIYDNDAIEGLNLPNNMKAESARKMEQGLLQGVQLPISSIGTVTSEVTSAITATTQVAKQILNQSLSQVKVQLKANYEIFLKEETREDKRKRETEQAEMERLYKQIEMQNNEPQKKNPLESLIESM